RVEVLADQRHPARQGKPLLRQDVGAHSEADHEQHKDGGEVLGVLADRGPHRRPPLPVEANGFRCETISPVRLLPEPPVVVPCPEAPWPLPEPPPVPWPVPPPWALAWPSVPLAFGATLRVCAVCESVVALRDRTVSAGPISAAGPLRSGIWFL